MHPPIEDAYASKIAKIIEKIVKNYWNWVTTKTTPLKSSNQNELDRIGKIVQKINSLEEKTKKGSEIRKNANQANRALGTYGNRDGKDAAHTGKNRAKLEAPSTNRANPRKGKKYSSGKGRKVWC